MRQTYAMDGSITAYILCGVALAAGIAGLLFVRAAMSQRNRKLSAERAKQNRALQFAWDMIFKPRQLRLTDARDEARQDRKTR
jgi:uncharacterized protein HemX